MRRLVLLIIIISTISCNYRGRTNTEAIVENFNKNYISDGFDFPVGKPNAKDYYNAQKFTKNNHLGDDWNGVGGGNTDLGDPIYAAANGYVIFADEYTFGWGKVIRIIHVLENGESYETVYAHCNEILTTKGTYVSKGTKIGTIGTANGKYLAHLHFEIRDKIGMGIGSGYSKDTTGYVNPTKFIKNHRTK